MRFAWLVVIAACGSVPDRHVTFAGALIDAWTDAPIAGATVVIENVVALSDEHGEFRIEAGTGRRRLTIYEGDQTIETDVEVSGQHVRVPIRHRIVDELVAKALAPHGCVGTPQPVAQSELDAIGRVALAHARELPDASTSVVSRSDAEVQAEADRTATRQRYLHVDPIEVAGDCATVTIHVSIAQPRATAEAMLCCCTTTDIYVKHGGRWRFDRRLGTICG